MVDNYPLYIISTLKQKCQNNLGVISNKIKSLLYNTLLDLCLNN